MMTAAQFLTFNRAGAGADAAARAPLTTITAIITTRMRGGGG